MGAGWGDERHAAVARRGGSSIHVIRSSAPKYRRQRSRVLASGGSTARGCRVKERRLIGSECPGASTDIKKPNRMEGSKLGKLCVLSITSWLPPGSSASVCQAVFLLVLRRSSKSTSAPFEQSLAREPLEESLSAPRTPRSSSPSRPAARPPTGDPAALPNTLAPSPSSFFLHQRLTPPRSPHRRRRRRRAWSANRALFSIFTPSADVRISKECI